MAKRGAFGRIQAIRATRGQGVGKPWAKPHFYQ